MRVNFGILISFACLFYNVMGSYTTGTAISDSSGWVVVVDSINWGTYPESAWRFPKSGSGDGNWWVDKMANGIRGGKSNRVFITPDAGGGWEIGAQMYNPNYHFGDIPYSLLSKIFSKILTDSHAHSGNTNTFSTIIGDTKGKGIFIMTIKPSNGGQV